MLENQNNLSKSTSKQLRFRIGIAFIICSMLSVIIMLLSSLEDILFPLFFIFLLVGVILIAMSTEGKWQPRRNSKWLLDGTNPSNPYNTDRR